MKKNIDHIQFCSGNGQFHTNETGKENRKPYLAIGMSEVQNLVDDPPATEKTQSQWLIPSILPSRTFKTQEQDGEYWALWLDFDDNPLTIAEVEKHLISVIGSCQYEIYITSSAKADYQKSRVIIFLDKPLNFNDWTLCQQILNDKMEELGCIPDRANERSAQLCYLPNQGKFYDSRSNRTAAFFDPLVHFESEIQAKKLAIAECVQAAQKRREEATARREKLQYTGQGPDMLIDAFNRAYTVEDILIKAGYKQRGNTFCHPFSETGNYAASIDPNTGRVHTLSTKDPLYSNDKGAHDAFSAFSVLLHGGLL